MHVGFKKKKLLWLEITGFKTVHARLCSGIPKTNLLYDHNLIIFEVVWTIEYTKQNRWI